MITNCCCIVSFLNQTSQWELPRSVLEWRSIYVLGIELRDCTGYRMTCFDAYVWTADSRKGDLMSIICKFTLIILGNSVIIWWLISRCHVFECHPTKVLLQQSLDLLLYKARSEATVLSSNSLSDPSVQIASRVIETDLEWRSSRADIWTKTARASWQAELCGRSNTSLYAKYGIGKGQRVLPTSGTG